ncbi:MAG: potassium-transporting ATPase subunit F [Ignavibacteriales bacterium]|nr:MAG: potassium-transporting ATPase subunit F [Ignavibacteriales bacterium]
MESVFEITVSLFTAFIVLCYLVYVLFNPEKF